MLCLEIVNNLIDNICDARGVSLGGLGVGGGIHLVGIFDKHIRVVPEEVGQEGELGEEEGEVGEILVFVCQHCLNVFKHSQSRNQHEVGL